MRRPLRVLRARICAGVPSVSGVAISARHSAQSQSVEGVAVQLVVFVVVCIVGSI